MPRKNLELATNLIEIKPQRTVDLFDLENLDNMSYAEFKEKKDMLSLLRQRVYLQVDGRKLQQLVKVMDTMDNILDRMMDVSIDEDGMPCVPSSKDINNYAAALKYLSDIMKNLGRLDTIDGYGTAREINIQIM